MRFAIAAGGTGGHLFPGLAVGEALVALGHEVLVLISEKEIDALATQGRSEFRFEKMPGVALQSKNPLAMLKFVTRAISGLNACRKLFAEWQPAAVLGMGGFTSLAPVLAGRGRKVPTFIHDSNAIPGKSNRLTARYTTAVLLGFAEAAAFFPGRKTIVTGTPVRRDLVQRMEKNAALAVFGLQPGARTLLVMGGSQGARGLNEAVRAALPKLRSEQVQFIHLAGKNDVDSLRTAYQQHGIAAFVAPFCHRMDQAYSAADFVIARSGASSLTEISHYGLPSLLVPYPHAADDHQTANARIFERAGAGLLLPESALAGGALADKITSLLADSAGFARMSDATFALAPRDAAARVAETILSFCS